jgi:hypothetical protein
VHGPDAVIVERKPAVPVSGFSKLIAFVIEAAILVSAVGFIAGRLGAFISHMHPVKAVSTFTVVGVVSALLLWITEQFIARFQLFLKVKLNIADKLAPYFGHKLDETYRIIRG